MRSMVDGGDFSSALAVLSIRTRRRRRNVCSGISCIRSLSMANLSWEQAHLSRVQFQSLWGCSSAAVVFGERGSSGSSAVSLATATSSHRQIRNPFVRILSSQSCKRLFA